MQVQTFNEELSSKSKKVLFNGWLFGARASVTQAGVREADTDRVHIMRALAEMVGLSAGGQ
jgi:hypothetical protein